VPSGTAALRIGFEFLRKYYPSQIRQIYVPNVTWSLHHKIIEDSGFKEVNFRYYDPLTKGLDIYGMLEDLETIPDRQILLI
jgi:aspartate/tyrosine/aromatic aminotransferase